MYREITDIFKNALQEYNYEIIMVNDGSQDQSWEAIKHICKTDTRVVGVYLSRNFGKELALSAGLNICTGDCAITLDADGQHPVEKIPEFISFWESGHEIIYGIREWYKSVSWIKKKSSVVFYTLYNAFAEFKLEPWATDYRLLDRWVIDIYKQCSEKNRMYRWLVDWLWFKRKSIRFSSPERINGKSTYSYKKLFKLAINNVTSFSLFPLKFVLFLGIGISISSGALFTLQLMDKLWLVYFGFSNLGIVIVINTMMIGIVMIALGVLGIYIANINEEILHRPLYIVREKIN
jgi:polyisoprenyl-phosphate glycosyltransferase